MMKTCVVIPTYNESRTIADIVQKIKGQGLDVLVIDDGSTDGTGSIAKNSGAIVLRNETNEGKGASLILGFYYALNKNFDAVITMDGDGQHLPEEILFFLKAAAYSNSSIIIGNRMSENKNMPLVRILTNRFMSWLISKIIRQQIPDTQCGFRLIKRDVLEKLCLVTSRYETETELLIKSSRLGFKIESIPIKTIYSAEKSQIQPLRDTFRFFKFILNELWTTQN